MVEILVPRGYRLFILHDVRQIDVRVDLSRQLITPDHR